MTFVSAKRSSLRSTLRRWSWTIASAVGWRLWTGVGGMGRFSRLNLNLMLTQFSENSIRIIRISNRKKRDASPRWLSSASVLSPPSGVQRSSHLIAAGQPAFLAGFHCTAIKAGVSSYAEVVADRYRLAPARIPAANTGLHPRTEQGRNGVAHTLTHQYAQRHSPDLRGETALRLGRFRHHLGAFLRP